MLVRRAAGEGGGCGIAVMAKASDPGKAKTRLAPPLDPAEAADLNTAFLKDVTANLTLAAAMAPIAAYMAYGPPGSVRFFEANMPDHVGLIEAWLPSLGDCLRHVAATLLDLGHCSACLLNSDSPTLPTAFLVEAASVLAAPGDRIVLGPATDGGYYLVGLKQPHRRLFENIDWSTERVARQTLERAAELRLDVVLLPEWYDVDDQHSLRRLTAEVLGARPPPASPAPYPAPHSAAQLRRILSDPARAGRLQLLGPAA